jgi:hypothetical protein
VSPFYRPLIGALLAAALVVQSSPSFFAVANAAAGVVAPGRPFFGARVDLRTLPARPVPGHASRTVYAHRTSPFGAPEGPRVPPFRLHHDRDPLSLRLFRPSERAVQQPAPFGRRTMSAVGSAPGTSGQYPWWSFEAHNAFEAMGNALVNVATGNLLLSTTDLTILKLARFRGHFLTGIERVYHGQATQGLPA